MIAEKNQPMVSNNFYEYMPKNTFRMLLAGNSGSGKTNLLSHILQYPLIYYDQIHLYAKNLDQDKVHKFN